MPASDEPRGRFGAEGCEEDLDDAFARLTAQMAQEIWILGLFLAVVIIAVTVVLIAAAARMGGS